MPNDVLTTRPARTVLEQKIRERNLTFEEFTEYAEVFARQHHEAGTLSVRHLQRLVAGRQPDGSPLGPPRPATARLLEHIFGLTIGELLTPPATPTAPSTVQALRIAIAVVVKNSEVLLVRRRGEPHGNAISWQFPAGIIKPGVAPETVATRETLEETGVHCAVTHNLGNRLHPITNVFCDYLLCEYLAGDADNLDPVENIGVLWIGKTTLTRFIPAHQIFPPILAILGR